MTNTNEPPAGWMQDPDGDGVRWWDGERFTDRVKPARTTADVWALQVGLAAMLAICLALAVVLVYLLR